MYVLATYIIRLTAVLIKIVVLISQLYTYVTNYNIIELVYLCVFEFDMIAK